jgi:hypothetical protein
VEIQFETMTPARAKDLLENSKVKRKTRQRVVDMYAEDMANGRWLKSDGVIALDKNGALLQGKHRLTACVQANKSFKTFVAYGMDASAQLVMDSGVKRTLKDLLAGRDELYPAHIAAILRLDAIRKIDPTLMSQARNVMPSQLGLLQMFDEDPDKYRDAARRAFPIGKDMRSGGQAVWGVLWLTLSEIAYDDAAEFFAQVATGEMLEKRDPVYALRRAIMSMEQVGTWPARRKIFAMTIKAWNAWQAGEKVEVISWRAGGLRPEAWPEPVVPDKVGV